MSNAIFGIALPASIVGDVRWSLADLERAPNELVVAYKLGEVCGSIQALWRLQRLSRDNCDRLCGHASELAHKRETALREQGVSHGE